MSDQNKEIAKELTLSLIENKRLILQSKQGTNAKDHNEFVTKEVSRIYKQFWETVNDPTKN
ncbi:hypothetical protein [Virgibacillus halodenitrificans]|uniref:hypothetical protein n=1 Tax=Virgibacillus halodenitrificans TaxID=1482 RepID=UPI000EF46D9D|nr:hypothetical protein [Virgibacillus halodenitrificans]